MNRTLPRTLFRILQLVTDGPRAWSPLLLCLQVTRIDFDGDRSDAYNVNALGRWTRDLSDRWSIEIPTYYERTFRNEFSRSRDAIDTSDLSIQQTVGPGERNNVIGGLGYCYAHSNRGRSIWRAFALRAF